LVEYNSNSSFTLFQKLDRYDLAALSKAWKSDQEREKLVKAKLFKADPEEEKEEEKEDGEKITKDSWFQEKLNYWFPPHSGLLSEIHDDALKLQTKIAKAAKKKARAPLENSIQNKVRRTFPSLSFSWFC
jgi:hypothetical protein